jgi:hypothetical protein
MKCRLQGAAAGCTHGRYIRWHLGRTALQRPETRAAGWETFLTRQIVYKVERFTVDVAAAWAPAGLQTAREASKRILASTDALRVEHKHLNLNLRRPGRRARAGARVEEEEERRGEELAELRRRLETAERDAGEAAAGRGRPSPSARLPAGGAGTPGPAGEGRRRGGPQPCTAARPEPSEYFSE